MTNYRKRPTRVPVRTSKPLVIQNEQTASLLNWLQCYPVIIQNPRAWLNRQTFTAAELHEAYEAGFHSVAFQLGYQYQHHTPLKANSTPMIISIALTPQPDVMEKAAA